jgi:hypothetical protein
MKVMTDYQHEIGVTLRRVDILHVESMNENTIIKALLFTALVGGDSQARLEAKAALRDFGIKIVTADNWMNKCILLYLILPFSTMMLLILVFFPNPMADFGEAFGNLLVCVIVLWIALKVISRFMFFPKLRFLRKRISSVSEATAVRPSYACMTNDELLSLNMQPSTLTKDAAIYLKEEIERRGLSGE